MSTHSRQVLFGFTCFAVLLVTVCLGSDVPPPPPVSKFAPSADLIALSTSYAESFAPALASSGKFKALQPKTQKDAHTLAVLGLALSVSDEDHPLKKSSPALVAAAQKLATATDFATGTEAYAEIQAALAEGGAPPSAGTANFDHWQQVAPLDALMKQVTFVYNRLKRGVQRKDRFDQMAEESARYAAILAVIGQVTNYDTHEVKNPAELPEWVRFSGEMRDAAGEVGTAIRSRQFEAATLGMKRLEASCKGCHQIFRKELVE